MTMDFSSCSVYDEFPRRRGEAGGGQSCEGDKAAVAVAVASHDPADLLPADPFGMELSGTFAAALAGWIESFGASRDCYWNSVAAAEHGGLAWPAGLPSDNSLYMQELLNSFYAKGKGEPPCSESEGGDPPEGLAYAIGRLELRDLLSLEMVCTSLYSAVRGDGFLWRCVHIDSPALSNKITDDDLLRLTRRAQGRLKCLILVGCNKITDEGLKRVLERNPKMTQLSIPKCLKLNIDVLINNLKALKAAGSLGLKHIKLGSICELSLAHYEDLKMLVVGDDVREPKARKLRFSVDPLVCDDERAIDVELCPKCEKIRVVYDCSSGNCQAKGIDNCRGCILCIERCTKCGRCLSNCTYVETFFLDNICITCWDATAKSPEKLEE